MRIRERERERARGGMLIYMRGAAIRDTCCRWARWIFLSRSLSFFFLLVSWRLSRVIYGLLRKSNSTRDEWTWMQISSVALIGSRQTSHFSRNYFSKCFCISRMSGSIWRDQIDREMESLGLGTLLHPEEEKFHEFRRFFFTHFDNSHKILLEIISSLITPRWINWHQILIN